MGTSVSLVVIITIVFVVLLNWIIIRIARSSAKDSQMLKLLAKSTSKPFAGEQDQLRELSQLVGSLEQENDGEE